MATTSQFQVQAEVVRIEQFSSHIYRLTVMAPEIAGAAKPGQFVMVRVADGFDPLLRRPISIHQTAAGGRLQLLFKVVGSGTRLLSYAMPGRQLDLVGPLGTGFPLVGHENKKLCLIGGGMGVAPLLFLAKRLIRSGWAGEILVLLGAATKTELIALAEFRAMVSVRLAVSTDDGSFGYHGYVTELMSEYLGETSGWQVFSCGPYPMLRRVAELCRRRSWGCLVSLEAMMACGMGACLGCVVPRADDQQGKKYWHVCSDGPVFAAEDLQWR